MAVKILLILLWFSQRIDCRFEHSGNVVTPTQGEIWPKPQTEEKTDIFYVLDVDNFQFNNIPENCVILNEAAKRYTDIIYTLAKIAKIYDRDSKEDKSKRKAFIGNFTCLDIILTTDCNNKEYPGIDMHESYHLLIQSSLQINSLLQSNTVWGILRGLETFSQLLYTYDDDGHVYMNATMIFDYPRFVHRGLLLDTSRHYMPVSVIYKQLDAMAYNKMNVFHWHIVDDESFPYQSEMYPELRLFNYSEKGAYAPFLVYTACDVRNIIEYARLRGIRVVPEFDTPGHARSWGKGLPGLLTTCYEDDTPTGEYGPIDPSSPFLYSFLDTFFSEVKDTFPEKYTHLGGDEVNRTCWRYNEKILDFMERLDLSYDFDALQAFYMARLIQIVTSKALTAIVWEECFLTGTIMPPNTVVQFWKNDLYLENAVAAGYKVLISSCWYVQSSGDWKHFYNCEPTEFVSDPEYEEMILGGETCMWGELVDSKNVLQTTWPKASATAEKLWSQDMADQVETAQNRLEEHVCRMNRRSIPAKPPNGAGYCLLELE